MEDRQEEAPADRRTRYVWDRDKLAWVETPEATPQEEPPAPESAIDAAREEAPARGTEREQPIEAAVEELEVPYRGALIRLGGIIVDLIVLAIIAFIIDQVTAAPAETRLALGFVYFVGFWWWRGQTPGKMLIGAKIVRADGTPIGPLNAILRWLFYFVPAFAPILFYVGNVYFLLPILGAIIGLIIIGVTGNKRGLHDMLAGTYVVNTRAQMLEDYASERGADEAAEQPEDRA